MICVNMKTDCGKWSQFGGGERLSPRFGVTDDSAGVIYKQEMR